jgi:CheY-like chemotaxis protein
MRRAVLRKQPGVAMLGLLLSDDLIFTSRITGTAQLHGLTMKSAKDSQGLLALAKQQAPTCVIVDLANPGLDIVDLIEWLKENCQPPPRVVAYGSHVHADVLKHARQAGCDDVLPRSKFVEELPTSLPQWLGLASAAEPPNHPTT